MSKIGYKVLTIGRGSAVVGFTSYGKYYPKGKKIVPKFNCGPLCIFDTYNNAYSFCNRMGLANLIIVKCKYIEALSTMIWNDIETHHTALSILPPGTILASSVICLE